MENSPSTSEVGDDLASIDRQIDHLQYQMMRCGGLKPSHRTRLDDLLQRRRQLVHDKEDDR